MASNNTSELTQLNAEFRQMMQRYEQLFEKFGDLFYECADEMSQIKEKTKTLQKEFVFEDKEEEITIHVPDLDTFPNRQNLDINTLKVEVIKPEQQFPGLKAVDDLIEQMNAIPIPKSNSDTLLDNIQINSSPKTVYVNEFEQKVNDLQLTQTDNKQVVDLSTSSSAKFPQLYGSQLGGSVNKIPEEPFNIDTYGQMCDQLESLQYQYQLPQDITELYDVKELDLSDWNINRVKKDFEVLYQIEELNFSNNLITSLDFGKMSSLKRLRLSNNKITDIPANIANLVNLEELYLDGNNIYDITPICQLPKLRVLHIQGNRIVAIPKEFKNLVNLKDVHLDSLYQTINELKQYPNIQPTFC